MSAATPDSRQVSVRILDKEYCLACEEHEQADLLRAVDMLNERLSEFRERNRIVGSERIAVLAAVHLAYDILLEQRRRAEVGTHIEQGIRRISARIEDALAAAGPDGPDAGSG